MMELPREEKPQHNWHDAHGKIAPSTLEYNPGWAKRNTNLKLYHSKVQIIV